MQYHGIPYNTMQYHEIPCNTIRCNAIPWNTIRYNAMTCNTMQYHKIKCNSIQYHTMPCQKGNFGQSGHKTARRAAEWAPTGKPKVSKVASGYGEVMIPLSLVRLSPKKGGYMGVAWKIWFFGQFWPKNGPCRPPRSLPRNAVNTKMLSFWCPVMMVTKCLDIVSKTTISGQKTAFLA